MPKIILISTLILLVSSLNVQAADRFLLEFKLMQGDKVINTGKGIVAKRLRTWSFGTMRSYLRLRCHYPLSGKVKKNYSTEDNFDGLNVQFKMTGEVVDISVTRNLVQPRLEEIRALAKDECKNLTPIVITTTEKYRLPAQKGQSQIFAFGDNMQFVASISAI